MRQLFISDLHLWDKKPNLEQLFHQFMETQASSADELYVLGDLFEVWIGDDATDDLAERVINSFSQYSQQGGHLFFCHGNRDFLLGADFFEATGGTLLDDIHQLKIAGINTLLMHGDSLCTDDIEYINFRNTVRSPLWQTQFLNQSIEERQAIAQEMRDHSMDRGSTKNEITDVNQDEVIKVMLETHSNLLIHGHTHRQNRHQFTLNNSNAERIVLGDWGETGSVLIAEDQTLKLTNFTLNA